MLEALLLCPTTPLFCAKQQSERAGRISSVLAALWVVKRLFESLSLLGRRRKDGLLCH
ncbi:hypothetical protein CZ787_07205 [Halomonas citrativorans]|uniref:Uncharacterized protein n=1 Tax=Halomonas citrativorans TaxID=2742612 RepID=A0A1R4HWW3_9GAMM|nr:hypothetical protein CZ787_07205 [Halomonas citrativorans]